MSGKALRGLSLALLFSTAYLGFGLAGRMLAEHRLQAALDQQGIAVTEVRAVPIAFNSLIWRVLAKTPQGDYYEAISSLFDRKPPEMLRLSRHLDAARPLAGSALHERLRWFTDDWLRYDEVGDALVVTDLRMGVPGNYTFRFDMARRDRQGQWQARTPTVWVQDDGVLRMDDVLLVWRRIFDQQTPLPLSTWAARQDQAALASGHPQRSR